MFLAVLLMCAVIGSVYGKDCNGHTCDGGKCIRHSQVCDCRDDCDDHSDEAYKICGFNKSPNPRECASCSTNGFGHIHTITWDDARITNRGNGPCDIILAKTKLLTPGKFGFKVVGIMSKKYGKKYISALKLDLYHGSGSITKITLAEDGVTKVDGRQLNTDQLVNGFQLPYQPDIVLRYTGTKTTYVNFTSMIRFMYRTKGSVDKHHVNILIFDKSLKGKVHGICGNFNGHVSDDYIARGGTGKAVNVDEVVRSWTVGYKKKENPT